MRRRKTAAVTMPVRLALSDLLLLGLSRLRTRPMRAALSALGISIGIATMIVVTGIPASSQQAVLDELAEEDLGASPGLALRLAEVAARLGRSAEAQGWLRKLVDTAPGLRRVNRGIGPVPRAAPRRGSRR